MENIRLKVNKLNFAYGEKKAIEDVSLRVKEGQFVGVIGPNGSGKSTVLKNIYRALKPLSGQILLDNENLLTMNYKKSALKLAVVGQENEIPFDFTIEEMVSMGRNPHKKLFEIDNGRDHQIVHHALEHVGLEGMEKRSYSNLSGGEKQRVLIARAVAQESDFFILDEPTNHLDISYQMQIFDFIKRLKISVLSAIHDLNLAALYCDYIYVMKEGKIILQGTPDDILTEENIYQIYGVDNSVTSHPITRKPSITFLPEKIKERI